jgi:hypothetical protein
MVLKPTGDLEGEARELGIIIMAVTWMLSRYGVTSFSEFFLTQNHAWKS